MIRHRPRYARGGTWLKFELKNDYLVVNDPGSKFDKAQQLGVKILNEQAFLEIFKQWSIDREKMCF